MKKYWVELRMDIDSEVEANNKEEAMEKAIKMSIFEFECGGIEIEVGEMEE